MLDPTESGADVRCLAHGLEEVLRGVQLPLVADAPGPGGPGPDADQLCGLLGDDAGVSGGADPVGTTICPQAIRAPALPDG